MDSLIAAAVLFVVSVTGWAAPDQPIKIVIDEEQIFLNSGRTAAYQGNGIILLGKLPEALTYELVHEVVHHFQDVQGRIHRNNTSKEECMLEVEAERIGNILRKRDGLAKIDFYEKLCEPAFRETKKHHKKGKKNKK
ncbi:MAG: hypothetical protein Q8R36_00700 [bacterium]|nr:hypothetical protein [bacterium]